MNIIYPAPKFDKFDAFEAGTVFGYKGKLYMRLKGYVQPCFYSSASEKDSSYGAVCLNNGTLADFSRDCVVERVSASMRVNYDREE